MASRKERRAAIQAQQPTGMSRIDLARKLIARGTDDAQLKASGFSAMEIEVAHLPPPESPMERDARFMRYGIVEQVPQKKAREVKLSSDVGNDEAEQTFRDMRGSY
jgi:hypothetical protein